MGPSRSAAWRRRAASVGIPPAVAAAAPEPDRPLHGQPHPRHKLHPGMYVAELVGTALMVAGGLSIVIALFGTGAPFAHLIPAAAPRRALAGFLFGSVGALVAVSPLGKVSGAHINPAVTFAFWLEGKIKWRDALGYVLAQLMGGVLGAVALLPWGAVGRSVSFGASLPAPGLALWMPMAGEALCTYLLVTIIFVMAAHKATQPLGPLTNPPLFSLLVWLESPLSGASTNPARSLGPAFVASAWHGQWIYVLGPCLGAAIAVALLRLEGLEHHRPREARRFHFTERRHPADRAPPRREERRREERRSQP
ncbi:MAG TPA: aquaporin [Alphaproteobacteria bacterium]|nr:aquaporin [Alphaproteobacteria bacterium]